jgi:hypothetical protein
MPYINLFAKSKKAEIERSLNSAKIYLIVGVLLIFIAPFILTQPLFLSLIMERSGQLGDTIGGITSPLSNVLGAVLVYYALKAQLHANELIQNQIDTQQHKELLMDESNDIQKLYGNLKDAIDHFTYSSLSPAEFGKGAKLSGSEAIYQLIDDFYLHYHGTEEEMLGNPKITELISIIDLCSAIFSRLDTSHVPDKDTLCLLTVHQFTYRIFPRMRKDYPDNLEEYYCNACGRNHGLPRRLVESIKKIKAKIEHLEA